MQDEHQQELTGSWSLWFLNQLDNLWLVAPMAGQLCAKDLAGWGTRNIPLAKRTVGLLRCSVMMNAVDQVEQPAML